MSGGQRRIATIFSFPPHAIYLGAFFVQSLTGCFPPLKALAYPLANRIGATTNLVVIRAVLLEILINKNLLLLSALFFGQII